jgi:tRNA dimethylallyltransferase
MVPFSGGRDTTRVTVAPTLNSNPSLMPVVIGPTAGGKTRLAIELALRLGGECVSADSMQVYRGMDLGTAKPTAEERAAVPHHLLDVADPREEGFTVEEWRRLAEAAIADIRRRGRVPIVVGGTSLYVRALIEGLFEGPDPDPDLRAELDASPLESLREELERADPVAAARIHPNDRRRTQRAIEVFRQTGRPISAWQAEWDERLSTRAHPEARVIGLDWPVEAINRRINARVKAMFAGGLVEEARSLRSLGPLGRQAREAVGYGEALAVLDGVLSIEEAIERTKIRTRRYAKQQRTWLKRFRTIPGSVWIDAAEESEKNFLDAACRGLNGA